ncbi:hypothetical protein TSMEX_003057 [Taenia solium]|eukprot:TsM_000950200 transcript=TsM_000950200 gene=TsM_000950200
MSMDHCRHIFMAASLDEFVFSAVGLCEAARNVIAYASIRFSKKVRQRSATECELFAIFTMDRHFKNYLTAKQLIARTDHQALTWPRTMKEINRSVARWYEELQQYDFTVQYRKGTTHSKADALFRRPLSAERERGIRTGDLGEAFDETSVVVCQAEKTAEVRLIGRCRPCSLLVCTVFGDRHPI